MKFVFQATGFLFQMGKLTWPNLVQSRRMVENKVHSNYLPDRPRVHEALQAGFESRVLEDGEWMGPQHVLHWCSWQTFSINMAVLRKILRFYMFTITYWEILKRQCPFGKVWGVQVQSTKLDLSEECMFCLRSFNLKWIVQEQFMT